MSSSTIDKRLATAIHVRVEAETLRVRLSDGRELCLPVADYAFLRHATPEQRKKCVVDEAGTALFWPGLREGISVAGLLGVSEAELEEFAGLYPSL